MANQQNRSNKRQSGSSSGSSSESSTQRKSAKQKTGPGRGWHGDSEGHARAGAQSHKNK